MTLKPAAQGLLPPTILPSIVCGEALEIRYTLPSEWQPPRGEAL